MYWQCCVAAIVTNLMRCSIERSFSIFQRLICLPITQTVMDPNAPPGTMHADGSKVEFGGNTPTGGKFAEPWDWHGWTADPQHKGDSGFKRKSRSYYDSDETVKDAERQARIRKEVSKCTPQDEDDE